MEREKRSVLLWIRATGITISINLEVGTLFPFFLQQSHTERCTHASVLRWIFFSNDVRM